MVATVPASEYPVHPGQDRFPERQAEALLAREVQRKLQKVAYQADTAASLARELSDHCREQLTKLVPPRWRVVVQVVLAEQKGEGIRFASRALLDEASDRMVHFSYQSEGLICSVLAYGVYVT